MSDPWDSGETPVRTEAWTSPVPQGDRAGAWHPMYHSSYLDGLTPYWVWAEYEQ